MLRSSLSYYSDTYILVKGTITITGDVRAQVGRTAAQIQTTIKNGEWNKVVICKNCAPLTDWIIKISNT